MKVGDIVGLKHCTDFKGIVLNLEDHVYDEYGEHELKTWKILWFNHPYQKEGSKFTHVETYAEKGLIRYETKKR
tara:strand:- start:322 stop:543 length:222 start_codon:yes stop_codon:yes gene_type:complete